jgi:hypothetical protein
MVEVAVAVLWLAAAGARRKQPRPAKVLPSVLVTALEKEKVTVRLKAWSRQPRLEK